ncbi:glycoside hydrolase N-terminal domain-containing protein [Virgibacillus halodenitrificans]|uniref:glycosyl hydrolase family 95 catalytic domain-containing protein n=1 Tax=Virgibacillus halodenitrificans TaxID=1482 RepID=UPI0024C04DD9|nr:glycoside hydrolase N-terminal domain-containing protein [Virgibacillus halodenitrificans]WHX26107.1 glycoside hydrolase N-terminal domain-containing protein [Virgibacillus halodenitrificans]
MSKRKFKNRLAGSALTVALLLPASMEPIPVNAGELQEAKSIPPENKLALWYDEPAADWENEALPIGNGHMGGMVFGGIEKEHIQFNDKTLWSGGPNSRPDYTYGNRNGAATHLESVREKIAQGDKSGAQNEAYNYLTGLQTGFGSYQNFGDIYLDFDNVDADNVNNYRRELDIEDGMARVSYTFDDVKYKREYFVSYPDRVMVMHLSASEAEKLSLEVKPRSAQNAKVTATDDTITIRGKLDSNQMLHEAKFKVVNEGGSLSTNEASINVKDADKLTIVMTAATDYENNYPNYKGEDPHQQVEDIITKASGKTYEELKNTHLEDYQSLFSRVSLDLNGEKPTIPTDELLSNYGNGNQSLEELMFQYGRYLLISSSRPGTLPANLQGVWNNSNTPPWESDYHFNINLQMNYWPAEVTNLSETAEPLVDYVDSLREPGQVTAETHFGVKGKGWVVNTMNNPFGFTAPGWGLGWGWAPSANAFISQNLWEHYQFTKDVEYLEEKIYPIIKEAAEFHAEFLTEDTEGNLVINPCWSPEIGGISDGCAFDQQLVWELFSNVIEASEILGVDAEFREELIAKREKLHSPVKVGRYGQVQEWKEDIDDPNNQHRHVSQLVALYPGTMINRDTPEWLEAAKVTLNHRGDAGTGWSKANKINLWARLLDGNHAYKILQGQIANSTLENLFDTHPPFQIDGNFGYTSGVAEMLLQSHLDTIDILPALPDAWSQGKYKGLVARGGFEVDVEWAHSRATKVTIKSKEGKEANVFYPGLDGAKIVTSSGEQVNYQVEEDGLVFSTKAGESYTITQIPDYTPVPDAPEELNFTILSENEVKIDWDDSKYATSYTLYRSNKVDGQYKKVASQLETSEYIDNIDLTKDDPYYYKVSAKNDTGESDLSKDISVSIPHAPLKLDGEHSTIEYKGSWHYWGDSGAYDGSQKYNNTPKKGDYAKLTFLGTGVKWIGHLNRVDGIADVYIDGEFQANVDTYGNPQERQVVHFSIEDLPYGVHTISVQPTGEQNSEATGNQINIDAFEIVGSKDIEKPETEAIVTPEDPNGNLDWYTSDVSVTLEAKDDNSNVRKTEYRINNADWVEYDDPFTISEEGVKTIDYRSVDEAGNVEEYKTLTVKVDKTAPELRLKLSKTELSKPNHNLVPIDVTLDGKDAGSGIDSIVLKSITSNEADNGKGDGNTVNDIQDAAFGTEDTAFKLRAERSGNGEGRVYTVTYTATDKAGNKVTANAEVRVPK